jgi:hypothetical protein
VCSSLRLKPSSLRPPQQALAGALQEDRGDLFFTTSVENKESPLYRALSRYTYTNRRDRQVYRDPETEVGLAGRLKISRPTLWRWRKGPSLHIHDRVAALSREQIIIPSLHALNALFTQLRCGGIGVRG